MPEVMPSSLYTYSAIAPKVHPLDSDQSQSSPLNLSEIGEQAALIAHDMRSPLCVILNGLRLCCKMPLPERARLRLTLALEEAERLKRMVDDLLAYARYSRHPGLRWSNLELGVLLTEVLSLTSQLGSTRKRRIVLASEIPGIWITGDRDKLKQVFINLLENACEATEPEDVITCEFELEKDASQIWVRIHNYGNPIPPEMLGQLTRCRLTTKAAGHGLGLVLVKRIVDMHLGKLTIESSASGGTIVAVRLPVIEYLG